MNLVKTSYSQKDVTVLLKDLSDVMKPLTPEEREQQMLNGVHYSEMLPKETRPSEEYFNLYKQSLSRNAENIASYIRSLAVFMMGSCVRGKPIIVSLARAGTPVGILIKRYIEQVYGINCSHYTISIIRDKGIDRNAMQAIYTMEIENGENCVENIFFVDGWTGKGAIQAQLTQAVKELRESNDIWQELHDWLFVLADPGGITPYCATREDCLLPSACLNSTVSGLISRSILNKHIDIEQGDFHGAVYFKDFEDIDCSNSFLDEVAAHFSSSPKYFLFNQGRECHGIEVVKNVCKAFFIDDYLKVKPGIGETTRVLLRRMPYLILINETTDLNDPDIAHILELCRRKSVPIKRFSLGNYKVCGIIRDGKADT